jgi:hypothetical protein
VIARVFPRKTSATPTDPYAFIGEPPIDLPEDITEVHISVVFDQDLKKAFKLKRLWSKYGNVKIGGPATNQPSGQFTPGLYVKNGITITSRGCPNRCWFCSVWKREPELKELEIKEGFMIFDDNLLACSERHIRSVFDMLSKQKQQAQFKGGLEAALLDPWHVDLLIDLNPRYVWFAYDTPDDKKPLRRASKLLTPYFNRQKLFAYVLIGYPSDTIEKALERLQYVKDLGICPFAMLYHHNKDHEWKRFQREWCRPALIYRRDNGE